MAQRTTVKLVEDLLVAGGDWDGKTNVQQFIDWATAITSRVATCATNRGRTLTTEELELVERYLAAHGYLQADRRLSTESKGGASGTYQGTVGNSIDATEYGRSALNVDWSGCLTAISKRLFAGIAWLGKPVSEQINYDERD